MKRVNSHTGQQRVSVPSFFLAVQHEELSSHKLDSWLVQLANGNSQLAQLTRSRKRRQFSDLELTLLRRDDDDDSPEKSTPVSLRRSQPKL